MPSIERLLATYPRPRPPLTPAHAAVYAEEYERNRRGEGALLGTVQRLEGWMHRRVAEGGRGCAGAVLELGAGRLNHLPWEPADAVYDAVEPLAELCRESPLAGRVRRVYDEYGALGGIPDREGYGRIVSVATLEHLERLPWVVAHAARLLAGRDGLFQAGIPSEGGLAWGLAWRLSTGVAYRLRTGLDYGTLMRHEHLNTAPEVVAVVRHFFARVAVARFPLPGLHLSFYTYVEGRGPRRERWTDYLRAAAPA